MNTLNSRDLQHELDQLEAEEPDEDDPDAEPLDEEDAKRLTELRELAEEVSGWHYGVTLIPESDFEEYAQDLAEETVPDFDTSHWPYTCIDWEQAANDLRPDYSSVEFDGDTYFYQS